MNRSVFKTTEAHTGAPPVIIKPRNISPKRGQREIESRSASKAKVGWYTIGRPRWKWSKGQTEIVLITILLICAVKIMPGKYHETAVLTSRDLSTNTERNTGPKCQKTAITCNNPINTKHSNSKLPYIRHILYWRTQILWGESSTHYGMIKGLLQTVAKLLPATQKAVHEQFQRLQWSKLTDYAKAAKTVSEPSSARQTTYW